jgi:hypothetical protein
MNQDFFYDPPTYGGTPMQEAHAEMIQIFGMENPDRQWILSDYDVWERNPFYSGPEQQHPEDNTPSDEWEPYSTNPHVVDSLTQIEIDDCPF